MFLLWALLLLGVLVLVHELGHFTLAKMTGVKVLRFSIGFGPKLFGFRIGETEYQWALVPLGGYVKLLGQESVEEIPAGILWLAPDSPAELAGLAVGDRLLSIDGEKVESWTAFYDLYRQNPDRVLSVEAERNDERFSVDLVPSEQEIEIEAPGEVVNGRDPGVAIPELGLAIGDHTGDLSRAFFRQPLWARFVVVFAGPAASLLFPLLIYFVYFLSIDSMTSSRIGQILADTPASKAGLLPGDRIVSIEGSETPFWPDMAQIIRDNPERPVDIVVARGEKRLEMTITPESSEVPDRIGQMVKRGRIGIASATIPPLVGVSASDSPAARAGIKLGDKVLKIDGRELRYIWELEDALAEAAEGSRELRLLLERSIVGEGAEADREEKMELDVHLSPVAGVGGHGYGLVSADTVVGRVEESSPAAKAGIMAGDYIRKVDGRRVSAWIVVEQALREKREKAISLEIERDGRLLGVSVRQHKEVSKGEFGEEVVRYLFGAYSAVAASAWMEGEQREVENSLVFAASKSATTFVDIIGLNLRMFGMIFSGQVPFKMVGGPIMIFDIAGKAAERGWQNYLWIMALISINLGILNLLPVPVLDGGHLMFFSIEALIRRPINQKLKERATMVGFILLMTLMVLVFKNDIERYWDRIFG